MSSILVIDDDADIRETFQEILSDEGYDCRTAAGGAEALAMLRAGYVPGLILLDLSMPVMNGEEFLAEARRDPRLGAIPTVVVSASANLTQKVAELGVEETLRKPVDLSDLLELVARYCRRGPTPHPAV